MKRVIQIFLLVVIVVLGYLIVESIMKPIRFNRELAKREKATIENLKDIRTLQEAYKSKYNRYNSYFDTLIYFYKTDSFAIEKKIGSYDPDAMTEKQALDLGLLSIETTYVPVKDSLFNKNYRIDQIRYVPFTDGEEFELKAKVITAGGLRVPVFEASVENDVLLHGMERQLVVNYNAEREAKVKFAGLKVGSVEQSNNNAGNWE